MRYLHILLGLVMVAFAAVQYNDPDALLWIVFYRIPGAWAFAAAIWLYLVLGFIFHPIVVGVPVFGTPAY